MLNLNEHIEFWVRTFLPLKLMAFAILVRFTSGLSLIIAHNNSILNYIDGLLRSRLDATSSGFTLRRRHSIN